MPASNWKSGVFFKIHTHISVLVKGLMALKFKLELETSDWPMLSSPRRSVEGENYLRYIKMEAQVVNYIHSIHFMIHFNFQTMTLICSELHIVIKMSRIHFNT